MEYELLAVHDTDRLRIEARRYENGRVTVWWTDGPREDEQDTPLDAALVEVEAAAEEARAEEAEERELGVDHG